MINALVILLFVTVFLVEYVLRTLGLSSRLLLVIPELLSGVAMLVIVARAIAGRSINIDKRYLVFFILLGLTMLFGFVSQSVSSGAVVAGLRNYLKFMPFFLLPAVYPFTPRQLRVQLLVVVGLLGIQAPVAVYQRFFQFGGKLHTGDFVSGTVTSSGVLTLLMAAGIAAVVVLYLRKRIGLPILLVGVGMLFLPTTLNETKATAFIGPIAVVFPAFVAGVRRSEFRRLMPVVVMGMLGAVVFVQAYNSLAQYQRWGRSIQDYFTGDVVTDYLYTRAAEGKKRPLGRVDSVILAARQISEDPLSLSFGLGAGNASPAPIARFSGAYADYFGPYGIDMTQITTFLWEIGFVGVAVYLFFMFLSFSDARLLARHSEEHAALGQAWATIMVIMTIGLLYAQVFSVNEISYLFWYFSGLVASEARSVRRAVAVAARAPTASHVPGDMTRLPGAIKAHG